MPARPKLTDELERVLCEGLRLGMTYAAACSRAGISYETFRRWRKDGEARPGRKRAFVAAVKDAEAAGQARCLAVVHKAAGKGDWKAAAWILERRHGYTRDGGAKAPPPEPPPADCALTSNEKQLAEVRKMRAAAEESQSWVAATTLLREERALSDEIAIQRKQDEAAARAEVSAEDLLGELATTILGLPEGARERLLEMVDEG